MSAAAAAITSVADTKQALRRHVKSVLKALSADHVNARSVECGERLVTLPVFKNAGCISCYVSMPKELNTKSILQHAFAASKRVFIPKITGGASADMIMLEIPSVGFIDALPRDKWDIPDIDLSVNFPGQLHKSSASGAPLDGTEMGLIDVVLMPGVAFDAAGRRLGHGKGYYGE